MTEESSFFVKLNLTSNVCDSIITKIKNSLPDQWSIKLDQDILALNINDFKDDPQIVQAIIDLECTERLSVFRFHPNICYQWHYDKIRFGSINMLLTGFDSMCVFGSLTANNKFSNLTRLIYEPNKYYLMNVKKFHTVFNFSEIRHVVSIGIPTTGYSDSYVYLKNKNLI
jgi:hypothetical protein